MKTVIIKYQGGNVQSVAFALERLGASATVTDDADTIRTADRVIFPGVGEAGSTMKYLRERKLDQLIPSLEQPVLGICLGMQLMCRFSEENNTRCMGIFDVDVVKFPAKPLKVPHMGWNSLHNTKDWIGDSLDGKFAYFVHSFFAPLNPCTVAEVTYGRPFSAALRTNNFFAVQFHPEKSGDSGMRILKAFLDQSA
ncbi:MAG: imidazole glycerol phosphate synthase subunit HisH [Cyclobacteriaceae bacterium]|nr:imidazole glycerol phosphate synthase subunit HisH [Cyclobacteriaceae bacterium]